MIRCMPPPVILDFSLDKSGKPAIMTLALGDLCNGSTPDSDSVCGGSNPSSPAKENSHLKRWLFSFGAERLGFGRTLRLPESLTIGYMK